MACTGNGGMAWGAALYPATPHYHTPTAPPQPSPHPAVAQRLCAISLLTVQHICSILTSITRP